MSDDRSGSARLPLNTIAAGAHVSLDVRGCKLRVAQVLHDPSALATVQVTDYKLSNEDTTLAVFSYLQTHVARFGSVKII